MKALCMCPMCVDKPWLSRGIALVDQTGGELAIWRRAGMRNRKTGGRAGGRFWLNRLDSDVSIKRWFQFRQGGVFVVRVGRRPDLSFFFTEEAMACAQDRPSFRTITADEMDPTPCRPFSRQFIHCRLFVGGARNFVCDYIDSPCASARKQVFF